MTAQTSSEIQFEQLLPAFCRTHIVLRVMVLAQALAILLALASDLNQDFWPRLGVISLFIHWVALLTIAVLCRLQRYLARWSPWQIAALTLSLLLLFSVLMSWLLFSVFAVQLSALSQQFYPFLLRVVLIVLLVGVMGIQLSALYLEHSRRLAAQSRSELDALQARIQPHFLFNSLNTVAELTQQDPAAAETALLDLASLFRAALQAGQQVELAQELQLVRQYLALEQWRLGAKLQLDWQVPAQLPALRLPALTLQPLFENAVRHGIERQASTGVIRFELRCSQHYVTLLLTNPVAQPQQELELQPPTQSQGNGMALQNIRRRLALHFAEAAKLTLSQTATEFRVKLVLPLAMEQKSR
jgi:two-component system sensor histidine kinase AlgZ